MGSLLSWVCPLISSPRRCLWLQGKAPMSSSEARGTLFGALGGNDSEAVRQQQQLAQQAMLYAGQPGAFFPPNFPGLLHAGAAAGFPAADGAPATAEGAPVAAQAPSSDA